MEKTIVPDEDCASLPASSWVRFLRSYGPTPNNLNLFDEYVTGALSRAKVQPIILTSPYLEAMQQMAASGFPGSILIAGTAGDGKTYHCRSLWMSLGGAAKAWSAPDLVKTLDLADGRSAVFVKDLSELNDEQSDAVLELLERSIFGEENTQFAVIALLAMDEPELLARRLPFLDSHLLSVDRLRLLRECFFPQSAGAESFPDRRHLYQVAALMGHLSPTTTCQSYLHLLDWLSGRYLDLALDIDYRSLARRSLAASVDCLVQCHTRGCIVIWLAARRDSCATM